MKDLHPFIPKEHKVEGYYFESFDQSYAIVINEIKYGINCKITVFLTQVDELNGISKPELGDKILLDVTEAHEFLKMSVWGKYYFPEFLPGATTYQFYHENNEIEKLTSVMKFSYNLAMEVSAIKKL
jgi:hypothetical protein